MTDGQLRAGDIGRGLLDRYAILDTPPEVEFDDLVVLAAEICAAPIALVSFLTPDRQWFKARIGLAERETPIADALCALTIAEPDLFVIADLPADPRTTANRLVTRPNGVRFYAGVPLRAPSGEALGTLSVLDTTARPGG